MTQYSHEHILKYLDQEMNSEQQDNFKKELQNDPELRSDFEQLKLAHETLQQDRIDKAPIEFSAKVMASVSGSGRKYYYTNGLGSNSGFLFVSGILTALIALLSVFNSGYIDVQGLARSLSSTDVSIENDFLQGLVSQQTLTRAMMVIFGILAITILDRFVLNPMFRKRVSTGFD